MRKVTALVGTVLLTGCGGYQPVSLTAPAAPPQAIQCAREELQERGYTIAASNPTTTVTGVRVNTQPWYMEVLGFDDTSDTITALQTGEGLQVTATSSDPTQASSGGPADTADGATEEAARHAEQIVAECSTPG